LVLVQIYGVTTAEDARLVRDLGPDHVGLVLDEGIDTWDHVDEATAKEIVDSLAGTTVVGLSLSTDAVRIRRTVEVVAPDIVHLARVADQLEPRTIRALQRELAPVKVMVTIPVRGPEAVGVARGFSRCCDYLLADTVHPVTGVVGATGQPHDWSISARIVQAVGVPVILAGGLGPENVVEAIERVRPAGVDSETRTSREDDRRRKDRDKVRRFIELARASEPG
jgi:phosphoribosylanthranilate isomerase